MKYQIVCPGQGSQKPGMLLPWLELPGARQLLADYSAAAYLDLLEFGSSVSAANSAAISRTDIAQPLIVATSLLTWKLSRITPQQIGIVAGHSVGAITAGAISGMYDAETAIRLAATRGKLFSEIAQQTSTGMSALIGKDVLTQFHNHPLASQLEVAVINSDSQIVVAGSRKALNSLSANPPQHIRVTRLPVSAAFHTETMQPAVAQFAAALENAVISDPIRQLISDLTGKQFTGGEHGYGSRDSIVAYLISQITNPVRWDLVTKTLAQAAAESENQGQTMELAPAGTLTALLKRAIPAQRAVALQAPADLPVV